MPTTPHVIDILGDTIYLEVDGIHQDWKTYRFDLDIKTLGRKVSDTLYTPPDLSSVHQTFAFRIKESPFQPINAVEENLSQISSEGDSDNALASESTNKVMMILPQAAR